MTSKASLDVEQALNTLYELGCADDPIMLNNKERCLSDVEFEDVDMHKNASRFFVKAYVSVYNEKTKRYTIRLKRISLAGLIKDRTKN